MVTAIWEDSTNYKQYQIKTTIYRNIVWLLHYKLEEMTVLFLHLWVWSPQVNKYLLLLEDIWGEEKYQPTSHVVGLRNGLSESEIFILKQYMC